MIVFTIHTLFWFHIWTFNEHETAYKLQLWWGIIILTRVAFIQIVMARKLAVPIWPHAVVAIFTKRIFTPSRFQIFIDHIILNIPIVNIRRVMTPRGEVVDKQSGLVQSGLAVCVAPPLFCAVIGFRARKSSVTFLKSAWHI